MAPLGAYFCIKSQKRYITENFLVNGFKNERAQIYLAYHANSFGFCKISNDVTNQIIGRCIDSDKEYFT